MQSEYKKCIASKALVNEYKETEQQKLTLKSFYDFLIKCMHIACKYKYTQFNIQFETNSKQDFKFKAVSLTDIRSGFLYPLLTSGDHCPAGTTHYHGKCYYVGKRST